MFQRAEKLVYLVTDTSWWLDQGWRIAVDVVDRLEDGDPFFFVPAGVMRELDGLKRDSKRALEATKRIHELVSMGRCRIVEGNGRRRGVLASPVDEEVVEIARALGEKTGNVYLLTIDRAQMAVAENVGVESVTSFSSNPFPWWIQIIIFLTAPVSIPLLLFYAILFKPYKKEKVRLINKINKDMQFTENDIEDDTEYNYDKIPMRADWCSIDIDADLFIKG